MPWDGFLVVFFADFDFWQKCQKCKNVKIGGVDFWDVDFRGGRFPRPLDLGPKTPKNSDFRWFWVILAVQKIWEPFFNKISLSIDDHDEAAQPWCVKMPWDAFLGCKIGVLAQKSGFKGNFTHDLRLLSNIWAPFDQVGQSFRIEIAPVDVWGDHFDGYRFLGDGNFLYFCSSSF